MVFTSHSVPFPATSDRVAAHVTTCKCDVIYMDTLAFYPKTFQTTLLHMYWKCGWWNSGAGQGSTQHKARSFKIQSWTSWENRDFLNFSTVFYAAVRMRKLRKAYCSAPLVCEDNSMVFTSHSVPFPATRDLWSLVAGNGTSWETKTISFSSHQWR